MQSNSTFIRALADAAASRPLREKLLLAPSYRVGRQWLDQAASEAGIINIRCVTLRRLVLDLAEPALQRDNLTRPSEAETLCCLAEAVEQAGRRKNRYFARLDRSLTMLRLLARAFGDAERCGVDLATPSRQIRTRAKAEEIAVIYTHFEKALAERGFAGSKTILEAASAGLAERAAPPFLIVPATVADSAIRLERKLIEEWPEADKLTVPQAERGCQARMTFFTADTVMNESREALRRVYADTIPLDRVEICCSAGPDYIPALALAGMELFQCGIDELPFTFADGLPVVFSKPARLARSWLDWLGSGLAPEHLVAMLETGTLAPPADNAAHGTPVYAAIAAIRAMPLSGAIDEYRGEFHRAAEGNMYPAFFAWLAETFEYIVPIDNSGDLAADNPDAVLTAALQLLTYGCDRDGKFDAYARLALREAIAEWRRCGSFPGFIPLDWLDELISGLNVMGLGPMPGRLHVSEIASGGHSGRNHVFIIGLDDGRFPGRARQDPVLLDKERKRLSPELPLSIHRPKRREQALHRLCARLGADATLTLSHACRNGDAAVSASSAYRALLEQAGRTGLDNSVLHATLSPGAAAKGITRRDAWLAGLQRHAANAFTAVALRQWFPDLAAGAVAMAARASADFTEYDGYVPEAGADLFAPGRSWSESPSKLEKMAANPLDYFFLKVLRIEPAERYEITPGAWLPANEKGNLAHDLFREFFARLAESGGETTPERHAENRAFLQQLLRQKLAHYRSRALPRDELAYAREADELLQACEIFLAEELVCRSRGRPLYFEVALGLESDAPTPWDRDEPVWLLLPSGRVLGLRGRIDRIDRLHDGSGLIIVDYKTGSSAKHQPADPFRQGRQLQPLLYTHMLSHALEEAGRPEPVRSFRYFFPMPREEGLSVEYSRDKLAGENLTLADLLLDMLSAGCFPFTIDAKDCAYSDYAPIYQACGDCVAGAKRKAESHLLASWRELRKKK